MSDPFAALRRDFLARCMEDLARFRALAATPAAPEVRSLAHRLAGAGAAFGYPAISAAAGAVEERLRDGEDPSAALRRLMSVLETSTADP